MSRTFLPDPPPSEALDRSLADDVAELGYAMNGTYLWGHFPEGQDALFGLLGTAAAAASLTRRQRAVLVVVAAATVGNSYCALAWGRKLADLAGADVAAAVVAGDDRGLDRTEATLARWVRKLATGATATRPADVQELRDAGFDERAVIALSLFASLRIAYATVNDALGTTPDRELWRSAPAAVRDGVTFGRVVGPPVA